MTTEVGPGDALVALGAKLTPQVVSLLNRLGYERCREKIDWIAGHVGSRELAKAALGMPVEEKVEPSRGLGDTIAKATAAIGIKTCGGCKKRQALLNRLVPYKGNK